MADLGFHDGASVTAVYLHTFGCKANQYDTEVVRQALETAGVAVVDDPLLADAAVVNSCTVTHTGEAKMRRLVRRLARMRPGVRTVVMGCAAALDDGAIAALPGVERVVPGADPTAVLAALGVPDVPMKRILRTFARGSRAWLKIQDGCDEHCTFCATVLARGTNRSRPASEILEEARALAATTDEIVLTGVHIGSYGRDRGGSLGELVELLVNSVPGLRFRLSSVEATEVDDRLAELMIGAPDRLAPHLHAPLQSGSDRLLRRMGRHWYTAAGYVERIERLAARMSTFGLGADIIVGFPGETADDHRATRDVLTDLPFTYAHVFPYSDRPDAAARRLGPPVPAAVASARSAELRALVAEKAASYTARRSGEPGDVVLLGRRAGCFEGLTGDYLTVRLSTAAGVLPSRFTGLLRGNDNGLTVEWSGH